MCDIGEQRIIFLLREKQNRRKMYFIFLCIVLGKWCSYLPAGWLLLTLDTNYLVRLITSKARRLECEWIVNCVAAGIDNVMISPVCSVGRWVWDVLYHNPYHRGPVQSPPRPVGGAKRARRPSSQRSSAGFGPSHGAHRTRLLGMRSLEIANVNSRVCSSTVGARVESGKPSDCWCLFTDAR